MGKVVLSGVARDPDNKINPSLRNNDLSDRKTLPKMIQMLNVYQEKDDKGYQFLNDLHFVGEKRVTLKNDC